MLLLNAFSFNMIANFPVDVHAEEISISEAQEIASKGVESAIGHADTANVFSSELGVEVPANRVTVALSNGETVLVGQYSGPRLLEGTTKLPDEAKIQWLVVKIG